MPRNKTVTNTEYVPPPPPPSLVNDAVLPEVASKKIDDIPTVSKLPLPLILDASVNFKCCYMQSMKRSDCDFFMCHKKKTSDPEIN